MKKIAVIGGSGFVGTYLIELLVSSGYEIINFDKQDKCNVLNVQHIQVDIRDKSKLLDVLPNDVHAVILLAAEHRDDVSPTSLYYDVNVSGTRNVLEVLQEKNIKQILFTSSVAVYGLNKKNPDENHKIDPFNHYGKSKWQAEEILHSWQQATQCCVQIIRPTVIFGERNRGNVYNLFKQIASGKFLMIGNGQNKKSMAYVRNIVGFMQHLLDNPKNELQIYNYADKPDLNMNKLVSEVDKVLGRSGSTIQVPYFMGLLIGYSFDILAKLLRKKLSISSVRVRKFCATTQFDAMKTFSTGFKPIYSLEESINKTIVYEFLESHNEKTFKTE